MTDSLLWGDPVSTPRDQPDIEDEILLPDQTRIRVRPLRRDEERPIRELFEHLSLRSRYFRFLSPLSALPDALVRSLASVDNRRHIELVAEHTCGERREVVALAGFGANEDGIAEVGLVVRDDWQRRRIGTALATRVLAAAEARGFRRFIAHVATGNVAIQKLLKRVGHVVAATTSSGVSELVFVRRTNCC